MADLSFSMILRFIDQASGPLRGVNAALDRTGRAAMQFADQRLAQTRAQKAALAGEAVAIGAQAWALKSALDPAIAYEEALAGVAKVMEFERPDGLRLLGEDILALTSSGGLPMAAEGIAAIVEAGAQAGVVDKALPDAEERAAYLQFARDAAEMGIAFDIMPEQAGAAMATWRAAMKLSREESLELGNTINYLSNNMNASAPALVDIIRRQGALAMATGLTKEQLAALSATFLAGGATPEVAATALKNFTNALSRGESMTKRQQEVMRSLGLDAEEMARLMQEDAASAIFQVMEALEALPDHLKNAALGDLFGEESKGAIAPLLGNLDLLRLSFELAHDEAGKAGSMLAEFESRSSTTAYQLLLTRNYLNRLAIVVGSVFLPELNKLLEKIQPLLLAFSEWAKANPELIRMIGIAAAGMLAMRAATVLLHFAFLSVLSPILRLISLGGRLMILLSRLPAVLGLVTGALRVLMVAFAANPIGLVLTAIGAAAYVIYDNWAEITEWITDKVETIRAAFDQGLVRGVFVAIAELHPFTLLYEAASGFIEYLTGWDLDAFLLRIHQGFMEIDLYAAGVQMMQSLWNGWLSRLDAMIENLRARLSAITPDWMKGAEATPQSPDGPVRINQRTGMPYASGRDRGGPVLPGQLYEVGERGRELFVPDRPGRIVPPSPFAPGGSPGASSGGGGDHIEIHIHPQPGQDPEAIARAVRQEMAAERRARRAALYDEAEGLA